MREIQKSAEPKSLRQHRSNLHTTYDNYASKGDLRLSLVNEQYGLCCYCMQRIKASSSKMKIEHWKCQTNNPRLDLTYSNLLGACLGGTGLPPDQQHCDTKKDDFDLNYSPASHKINNKIKYLGNGKIESDDPQMTADIEILNLNNARLIANRKAVVDAFRDFLRRTKASDTYLANELSKWNGSNGGVLAPYCQIVVYYICKKLKC